MVNTSASSMLYVNPAVGRDDAMGSQADPYQTLTRALRRATAGMTVQLAPGTYSVASGEVFPLVVAAGVVVVGNPGSRGQGTVISGSGDYLSPTFARQVVALRLETEAELRGVTVTNTAPRGTGVWIESTAPAIAQCTFINCGREGVFASGTATPEIVDSVFQQNAASGISMARNAKGEIRRNVFQQTGYGIAISDSAAPLLTENQLVNNRAGVVVSGTARPVLRNNWIERSTEDGLAIVGNAVPDLGKSQDPGGNVFRANAGSDVRNISAAVLVSVGNQLNPTRINVGVTTGAKAVELAASAVVEQIRTVVQKPAPKPTPSPVQPSPAPIPTQPPATGQTGLTDLTGHWAESFIAELVKRGMISGFPDRTFRPDLTITRAQYAAVIARAFDLPVQRQSSNFVDVAPDFWGLAAIAKAEAMGFLAGFPDGTFRPDLNLTRVQTLVSLVNGLGLVGGNSGALGLYRDRAQIPTYATTAVATATQKRLVVNHPQIDLIEPMVDTTRSEVAAMIYQALVVTGQARAIASPYIVTPDAAAVSFADLSGHWASDFIRGLASQSLVSGFEDGSFRPDSSMSRAQYAALLVNTFNPLPKRAGISFSDVPPEHWAATAVQRVYQGRLLSGSGDGTFRPDQNITRIEVLLSLVNGLELPAGDLALLNRYTDTGSVPAFAQPVVASATAHRLVVNYPQVSRLQPTREASRAEVSAMVYQALVQSGRSPAISSPYIVDPSASASASASSIASAPASSFSTPPTNAPASPSASSSTQISGQATAIPPPTAGQPVVVLDPGHGGSDIGSGRIGSVPEKDLVLAIALDTATVLRKFDLHVVLTRTEDRTLSAAERLAIAQTANASVLVSLHLNATNPPQPNVNGLETYQYPSTASSAALAQVVHSNLVQTLQLTDRGIKAATFPILRSPTIAAIHLELGFLTGTQDALNLSNPSYRTKLSQAIAAGILQFAKKPVG